MSLFKPAGCTTLGVSPEVNSGLRLIMMPQRRFMDGNKCITGGGVERKLYLCRDRGYGNSVILLNSAVNLKLL